MASDVFIASYSDEEITLNGKLSGSSMGFDGASDSQEALGLELAHFTGSNEATASGSDRPRVRSLL